MKEQSTAKPPIVILSTINWRFLWQRHHVFATHLARTGHRVIFVESLGYGPNYLDPSYYLRAAGKLLRKVQRVGHKSAQTDLPQNLTVYTPIVAPPRPRVLRHLNKHIFVPLILKQMARMGIQNPVVWSYQPTRTALQVTRALQPRALVYDCVDNFAEVPGVPKDIYQTERAWLDAADLVFVTSSFLREKHAKRRPDLIQLPPGVNYELFSRAHSTADPKAPVRRVCFFGGMSELWFDFGLVESIADAGFSVSLIGYKGARHRLFNHPNVEYTSQVPQAELPAMLSSMDALLIPYKLNEFTCGVFPTKVYECLATGKPVVATPLPDLQGELAERIYLATDASEFVDILRKLPDTETEETVQFRLALARSNSWQKRLAVVSEELQTLLHA